jgi:hypothetical protein
MKAVSLAGGLVVAGLYLCIVAAVRPMRESGEAWAFAAPIFLIAWGAVAIALNWPTVQHERQVHLTDIERLRTEAYKFKQDRAPRGEREAVGVDAEAERQFRWHRFWSACLTYANEQGSFAYRGCFENILKYEDWRRGLADPLVRARWLEPVQSSIKTKPMPEWTATRMLAELAAGAPPPYPTDEPPTWKQTSAENTQKHSENAGTVFATDR